MTLKDPLDRQISEADRKVIQPALTAGQRERWQREAMGLRLSKSMVLREYAVDLDQLPQEFDVTPPAALEKLFRGIAIFFLVMTGIPFILVVGLNEPDTPWWVYPAIAFLPLVSIVTIVFCTKRIRRQRHLRFESDGVRVRQHGLGGPREWHARYAEFSGLVSQQKKIDTRYAQRDFHIIMLIHPEPGKNVPLLVDTGSGFASTYLSHYSERLSLPILEGGSS